LESEISIGSTLPLYTSSPPSLPLPSPSPSPIDSPPHYNNNMSQINLHEIIQQQQEQLAAMQAQIQALLAGGAVAGEAAPREVGRSGEVEVVKPPIFDVVLSKIAGFITACKLYMRMRMREESVEGQIQ